MTDRTTDINEYPPYGSVRYAWHFSSSLYVRTYRCAAFMQTRVAAEQELDLSLMSRNQAKQLRTQLNRGIGGGERTTAGLAFKMICAVINAPVRAVYSDRRFVAQVTDAEAAERLRHEIEPWARMMRTEVYVAAPVAGRPNPVVVNGAYTIKPFVQVMRESGLWTQELRDKALSMMGRKFTVSFDWTRNGGYDGTYDPSISLVD
jgi:hypothetical protein